MGMILFCAALLYASVQDVRTHMIPDWIHGLIFFAGLPAVPWVPAVLGLILVPLPLLVAALFSPGKMGGGDVKFMGACGFFLGVEQGFYALVIGLALAVLIQGGIFRKREVPFALVPYLAAGCMLERFIN